MEKLVINIEATANENDMVNCKSHIKFSCKENTAVAVLARLLAKEEQLRELITKALLFSFDQELLNDTPEITEEEYKNATKNNDDLEF